MKVDNTWGKGKKNFRKNQVFYKTIVLKIVSLRDIRSICSIFVHLKDDNEQRDIKRTE